MAVVLHSFACYVFASFSFKFSKQLYFTSTFDLSSVVYIYIWQMTRLFGLGDEFGEDAILGKIEGMKDIIEQVNKQFKDPVRYSYIHYILFLSFHC